MTLLSGSTPPWPTYIDDDGTGQVGTPLDSNFFNTIENSLNFLLSSPTNPNISPAQIIDEVVTARGNLANLNARLTPVVDANGNPVIPANVVTVPSAQLILGGLGNLVANDIFILWSQGDTGVPDHYTLTGAGATIQRCGISGGAIDGSGGNTPADTTAKIGNWCARVTSGSALAKLISTQISQTDWITYNAVALRGRQIACGMWVWTNQSNCARVWFDDGVVQTLSPFHPGDSQWHFLSVFATISNTASQVTFYGTVETSGSVYFSGSTFVFSPYALTDWIPAPKMMMEYPIRIPGNASVATFGLFSPGRPALVKDVQLTCTTAPATSSIIADLQNYNGAGYTTMFASSGAGGGLGPPAIPAAGFLGEQSPSAGNGGGTPSTYQRKCMAGVSSSGALTAGSVAQFLLSQIGTGTVGANVTANIRYIQYARLLEGLLGMGAGSF